MQEATLKFAEITLTLRQADGYHGIKMLALRSQAMQENVEATDVEAQVLRNMKALVYPICIASTVKYEGLKEPASFEEWMALPDQLLSEWQEKALEVNPHWSPFYKKEMPATSTAD